MWTIYPGQFAPIPSLFGIAVDPEHTNNFASLIHSENLPNAVTIKVDMKINYLPASDLGLSINSLQTSVWKGVKLYGIGFGGVRNTIQLFDSSNRTGTSTPWNTSLGIHHIEVNISNQAGSPIIVKDNGNTLLSWNSNADFNTTDTIISLYGTGSEFANYQLCDSAGCISSTPIPTTKVVVIPGFGASWNGDALLNCKSDAQGEWVENPIATFIYQPLRDALSQNSWLPLSYYYDWRKQIPSHSDTLAQFITHHTIPNENVHVVGHSMGGLVGRAYLEDQGENNRLDHFLSAGSPHHGMVQAYPGWAAGEVWDENLLFRIAMTTLLKTCQALYGTSDKVTVQQFVPSVQNLLPTFDYLRDKPKDQFKSVGSMQNKNNYLPTSLTSSFFGVMFGTLSGTGQKTLQSMNVKDQNKKQLQDEVWTDGEPTKKNYSTDGDGTILASSSMVEDATNASIPQTHIGIVQSSVGIQTILSFLGIAAPVSSVMLWEEPTSALVVMSYPSLFWVTEPSGKTYRDTDGIVAVVNPKKGSYKLLFQPKTFPSKIIVAQFLSGGKTLWKEYKHNSFLPKFGTISFDPINPVDNPLH